MEDTEEHTGVVYLGCDIVGGTVEGRKARCMDSCMDCMLPALEGSEDSGCNVFSSPHLAACLALPADGDRSSPCRRGILFQTDREMRSDWRCAWQDEQRF